MIYVLLAVHVITVEDLDITMKHGDNLEVLAKLYIRDFVAH